MSTRFNLIATLLIAVSFIMACGSSRNFASSKEDKDLFSAIKAIEKSNNSEARKDLPELYSRSVQLHEERIASYKATDDPDRWQNIIGELEALQNIYRAISSSPATAKLVEVQNYSNAINEARNSGAAEYYDIGRQYLQSDDRDDARRAYKAFQTVNKIHPNYKDASSLLRKAQEKGILDVVINPVQTRGYMFGGYSFAADNFQRTLVRDLGGNFGNTFTGARYYSDWDARRMKVKPDWVVDMSWSNMYIAPTHSNTFSKNVSKEIENGKDAQGKLIYLTVTATLHITQRNVSAQADMEYRITDFEDDENVEWNRIPAYLNYTVEYATYTGDSRALSTYDWSLVNNNRNMHTSESDIVDALYSKVYSQMRSRLENATRW